MPMLRHKIIYNQDSTNLFNITMEPITPLHVDKMVDEVADGGGDVFLVNPNFQRVNYPSRVWQTAWDGFVPGDASFFNVPESEGIEVRSHWVGQMKRLSEQCDYLERALSRCRRKGIAPGVTIRMNDMHDAPWPGSHLFSDFYVERPEYHIKESYLRGWGAKGLDYEHPEVRERFLMLIEEIVEGYDIEVLELDFMRFTSYFDRNNLSDHCATMTGFVTQVRDLLTSSGRDIALMTRIAATPAGAHELGFDVESWAKLGIVDAIGFGLFLNTGWELPVHDYRRLVGSDVALYPYTDYSAARWRDTIIELLPTDPNLLRGLASAYLASGADGIALFNFFVAREIKQPSLGDPVDHITHTEPCFSALREMTDLESLRGKSRRNLLTAGLTDFEADLPLQVPVDLEPGWSRKFEMLLASEPEGAQASMNVFFEGAAAPETLWIRVNDRAVGHADEVCNGSIGAINYRRAAFTLPNGVIKDGKNDIVLRSECKGNLTVLGLDVAITPKGSNES